MATPLPAFDTTSISWGNELRKSKTGPTQNLYCSVKGKVGRNSRVRFQLTPNLIDPSNPSALPTTPFKISEPIAGGAANKVALGLQLSNKELLAAVEALDAMNKKAVFDGRATFFPKSTDLSQDAIDTMYNPLVRPDKDGKYDPIVSVKVRLPDDADDDVPLTEILVVESVEPGADGVPIVSHRPGTKEDLVPGSRYGVVVEAVGLWFRKTDFGMSLAAKNIIVFPSETINSSGINAFSFASAPVAGTKRARNEDDAIDEEASGEL
jgi:hypothetical protein